MILFLLGNGFVLFFFCFLFFVFVGFFVIVECISNFDVNWSHFKSIHPPLAVFPFQGQGWGGLEDIPAKFRRGGVRPGWVANIEGQTTTLAFIHSGQFQLANSPLPKCKSLVCERRDRTRARGEHVNSTQKSHWPPIGFKSETFLLWGTTLYIS